MNLPTSFALPDDAVDRLRDVAGELLRQSPVYRRVVRDHGGKSKPAAHAAADVGSMTNPMMQ